MEKINVAELLKDCPKGMELDCTMFDNVTLDSVDIDGLYPIKIATKNGYLTSLTEYGQNIHNKDAKCVIFPKGKTTWEGFVPPCKFKDGDIIFTHTGDYDWVSIFKHFSEKCCCTYIDLCIKDNKLMIDGCDLCYIGEINTQRIATEEEKQKLFKAITDNGYRWNAETKTLEKMAVPHTTKKFYIRIGEIPNDEKSAVHRGDVVVGYENGVSVYDCVETDGLYRIVMPFPLKEGQGMTYEGMIQEITQCRYKIAKPRNVYLVSGREVGKGHDNEPLIKDVKILEDLTEQFNTKSDNTEKTIVKTEFREGDIVFSGASLISILKNINQSKTLNCYVSTDSYNKLYINEGGWTSQNLRHATEEEKKKLFKVINNNGYKWNPDTKTLDRLFETRFKVGDKIRRKGDDNDDVVYEINNVFDDSYGLVGFSWVLYLWHQDLYELVPDKFDINTLKPFESRVLIRDRNNDEWRGHFFSHHYKGSDRPYICIGQEGLSEYRFCIPFEGNEHLLGKTEDCEEFYKTWK